MLKQKKIQPRKIIELVIEIIENSKKHHIIFSGEKYMHGVFDYFEQSGSIISVG